jgi:hypothetical protein
VGPLSIRIYPWAQRLLRVGGIDDRADQVVVGRQLAHRVGPGGVTGELEGLAPAAAEVDLFARAAAAWLRHPPRSPEPGERRGVLPDRSQ